MRWDATPDEANCPPSMNASPISSHADGFGTGGRRIDHQRPFRPHTRGVTERLPAPSHRDKCRRAIWRVASLFLYRPVPTPLHGIRRATLRLFGATIGHGVHPYPGARIRAPWNLVMEDESCLGDGAECDNVARIVLRRGAIVSQRAHLCSASHDHRDPAFSLLAGPIVVGKNAWVAADAFIGPGVHVGEGSVVGARAVVMRSTTPFTVVAGNPARVVADRRTIRCGTAVKEAPPGEAADT